MQALYQSSSGNLYRVEALCTRHAVQSATKGQVKLVALSTCDLTRYYQGFKTRDTDYTGSKNHEFLLRFLGTVDMYMIMLICFPAMKSGNQQEPLRVSRVGFRENHQFRDGLSTSGRASCGTVRGFKPYENG